MAALVKGRFGSLTAIQAVWARRTERPIFSWYLS
jgi:hypothetical protein